MSVRLKHGARVRSLPLSLRTIVHLLNKPGLGGRPEEPVFQAVMIYQDFDAGANAWRFCQNVTSALGGTVREQMWNFDVLGIAEVRNLAVRAARKADVVIISASGHSELPPDVREWLELWLWMGGHENPALVALFDRPSLPAVASIRSYLKRIARSAGIEFLTEELRSWGPQARGSV